MERGLAESETSRRFRYHRAISRRPRQRNPAMQKHLAGFATGTRRVGCGHHRRVRNFRPVGSCVSRCRKRLVERSLREGYREFRGFAALLVTHTAGGGAARDLFQGSDFDLIKADWADHLTGANGWPVNDLTADSVHRKSGWERGPGGRAGARDDRQRSRRNQNAEYHSPYLQIAFPDPGSPRRGQRSVILSTTAWSMRIFVPHSRWVSGGHLLVASRPTLPPSPLSGDAKSR